MDQITKLYLRRFLQLFVLVGLPALGALYAYQFTGQSRDLIVPFQVQLYPADINYSVAGSQEELSPLKLDHPITVVNFWASWCPPCVEEFPAMMELKRRLEVQGVRFVFISVDERWEDVESFQTEHRIELAHQDNLWDPERIGALSWGSEKFPETYVVRRDGWVVEKIIGLQLWTRRAVVEYFVDLAERAAKLPVKNWSLHMNLIHSATAQSANNPTLLHEKDRKTLETLRKNIETASRNVRDSEGVLREERRNLEEQKAVVERRQREEAESRSDFEDLSTNQADAAQQLQRLERSKQDETREKSTIERRLTDVDREIADLRKRLEAAEKQRIQVQRSLDTAVQRLGVLDESITSAQTETKTLQSRTKKSKENHDLKLKQSREAQAELTRRNKRVSEVEAIFSKAQRELEQQKSTLDSFEKALER